MLSAALWTGDMRAALDTLVKRGALAREPLPGDAELFTRVRR